MQQGGEFHIVFLVLDSGFIVGKESIEEGLLGLCVVAGCQLVGLCHVGIQLVEVWGMDASLFYQFL